MVCFGAGSWLSPAAAVVYDLDETLIDSAKLHEQAWKEAGRVCDVAVSASFLRYQRGRTSRDAAQQLLGRRFDELGATLIDAKRDYVLQHIAGVPLFPDVLPALQQLADEGLQLGIFTSSERAVVRTVYAAHPQLAELVPLVVAREDYRFGKPSGEGLLCAARGLGVRAAHCLYVGDSYNDYLAACEAGCPFVLYARDFRRAATFPPVRRIRDHGDLPPLLCGLSGPQDVNVC